MKVIDDHDVTVWQGDALEQLALLPAESVQCIVTSPPYYALRDYGMPGQIGLEPSPAAYVETLRTVFAEARRVLAKDGVLWLNLGDSYSSGHGTLNVGFNERSGNASGARKQEHPRPSLPLAVPPKNLLGMPWRTAFALQDDGWVLRNDMIWAKPNAMPESVTDRLSTRHEHVFLFSRSRRYWFGLDAIREPHSPDASARRALYAQNLSVQRYAPNDRNDAERKTSMGVGVIENPLGRNPGDVWTIPTAPTPYAHFATMPPELVRRCILAGCPEGGTVLDPFAGSGTTLMVARKLARKAVGIELNPDYVDIIRRRIGQEPLLFGEAAV